MKKKSIVTKHIAGIGELKDIENGIAGNERREAMLDYIIACDYPEAFDAEAEVAEDE